MSIDDESALLRRTAEQLAEDDAGFAEAFRQWHEPPEDDGPEGCTRVPPWTLAVFLTGFVVWFAGPEAGMVAGVMAASWLALLWCGPRNWNALPHDGGRPAGGRSTSDARGPRRPRPDDEAPPPAWI